MARALNSLGRSPEPNYVDEIKNYLSSNGLHNTKESFSGVGRMLATFFKLRNFRAEEVNKRDGTMES
jgi:hypothetical protein